MIRNWVYFKTKLQNLWSQIVYKKNVEANDLNFSGVEGTYFTVEWL